MYKVITTTLIAGQTVSPTVQIPGRLVGYTANLDTAATIHIRVVTPLGFAGLFWGNGVQSGATLGAGDGGGFVNVPPNMPVGMLGYVVAVNAVQTTDRTVFFYYEDLPGVY